MFAMLGTPPDAPWWGADYKNYLAHNFTRSMSMLASTTSLAMERNNITLDHDNIDRFGRPGIRMTYLDHDDDMDNARFFRQVLLDLGDAAGATRVWADEVGPTTGSAHLLGTCRMGDDPATSVVDRNHRSHDVPNLFICDGSSMVTSGRGQPTNTIMALAFRAADKIKAAAAAGNI
jgi:choline dehydrogenase-like flavoprotein